MRTLKEKLNLFLTLIFVFMILSLHPLFAQVEVISEEDARVQAALSIIEHVAFETPLLEEWSNATLGEAILLWDPSVSEEGYLPILYDIQVNVNNEPVGRVSVPATPWLGSTRYALNMGIRNYNIEESLDVAADLVYEMYPQVDILSVLPVIYQYPQVAAMINVYASYPEGEYRIFIHLPTLRVLKSELEEALSGLSKARIWSLTTNAPPPGISDIYSIYDNIPIEIKHANALSHAEEWELVDSTMATLCSNADID